MKNRFLLLVLLLLPAFSITLNAKEYTNTSYYVAYDSNDKTQFALVMPSVNKIYTHQAGKIEVEDLSQIDTQFTSFPTYDKGELCFSALKEDASGKFGASIMAEQCYDVNFFYTQKEVVAGQGVAFILVYTPTNTVYEGLAGKSESFKVVKSGTTAHNENSITEDDYTLFDFNTDTGKVLIGEEPTNTSPTANAGEDQSVEVNQIIDIVGSGTDSDGSIVSYEWKKGEEVLSNNASFTYAPTTVGTDTLTLTVIDDDGAKGEDSMLVEVAQTCAQVISYATDPETKECKEFPTPCDVPSGWKACNSNTAPITDTLPTPPAVPVL